MTPLVMVTAMAMAIVAVIVLVQLLMGVWDLGCGVVASGWQGARRLPGALARARRESGMALRWLCLSRWAIAGAFAAAALLMCALAALPYAGRIHAMRPAFAGVPAPEEVCPFREGRARFRVGRHWGYLDSAGRVAVDAVFDEARDFHESRAAVRVRGKWGFVNKSGEFVVDPVYRAARSYSEGCAAVSMAGGWGFIDRAGRTVIRAQYRLATSFDRGSARVALPDCTLAYIDHDGHIVHP